MVNPITIEGIFNRFASEDAFSTKRFAPVIKGIKPTINNRRYHKGLLLLS
jgi:hypothetical protein